MKTIFQNPLIQLFLMFLLSSIVSVLLFYFGIYNYDLAILFLLGAPFLIYLIYSILFNLYLVLTSKLKWYSYLPIQILLVCVMSVVGLIYEGLRYDYWLAYIALGGFTEFILEYLMFSQKRSIDKLIKEKLGFYFKKSETLVSHPIIPKKYYFEDFNAVIYKITGVEPSTAAAVGSISTITTRDKRTRGLNAVGTIAAATALQSVKSQFGKMNVYVFDIESLNKEYEVYPLGPKAFMKSLMYNFQDLSLMKSATRVNKVIAENICAIYFADSPYFKSPILRITVDIKYFKENSKEVYLFIKDYKKILQI